MVIHSADRRMQIYGALLLLPAAVLLGTFAYLPTVTTLINSFFLPGFRGAPPEFVGLENYAVLIEDATFWRVARNNLLYALGTIPTSIALALGMALLVNARLPGRSFVRMAYFTPTILPMIAAANIRSEERRVGKERRSPWSPDHYKKKQSTARTDG